MKCPKCKKGILAYYTDNHIVACQKCDYRNGNINFIKKFRKSKNAKTIENRW